jgi:hypothetical protein
MFHQKQKIRHRSANHLTLTFVVLVLESALTVQAAQWQVVERHLPAAAASLTPVGKLADTNRLHLAIALPLRNQDVLSNLLQQLYDPASPNYHQYLTPDRFTEEFGPTAADYDAVIAFAKANGLPVEAMHSNRVLLDVSGTVAELQRALHITMRTYRHPTENRTFFAPDTAPTMDLAAPILEISGLNNYSLPRPYYTAKPLISGTKSVANFGSGLGGTYLGKDFRAAYLPGTTLDGSGQVVGLLEMDGYTANDIAYYESQAGLPNITLSNVLLDGFNGSPTGNGGEGEVSLDIEMAISMAPNLSQVIVYEAGPSGNWHDLLNRMATDNLASQISSSWGGASSGPDAVADQIWQQMAAQGQSFFQASGDKDAYTGAIPFPNDSPYITQVGGTTLTTSGPGGYWVSEKVWNRASGAGSGGGISTSYSIPSWQAKLSMTSNLGSKSKRNTPDVAMVADQIYVRADGLDYSVYGTSCAAPLWAGLTALANQQAAAAGQPAIGFINPAVYSIGTNAIYTQSFHDITAGNNEWYGSTTKFPAVSGYDLCTGWGTPKGQSLINALANFGSFLITPTTNFVSTGKAGGPFTVTAQKFTLTNAGVGSINWTLANTSVWLKASPTSGTLTSGGAAATVTVSLNTAASNLVAGTYSATVWFTNVNNLARQGRLFTLSVVSPPVITTQPTSQAVAEGRTAVFTVVSTSGISYQWKDNGTNLTDDGNISGSATTSLIVSKVSIANAGNYSVVVSNVAGTVTSSNALLTVLPKLPCDPPPTGMVSWWPGEGNANDVVGGNNGAAQNITYTGGEVGSAFYLNGSNAYVKMPAGASLNVGAGSGFTFEAWINPADLNRHAVAEWNDGVGDLGTHLFITESQYPTIETAPPGCLYANLIDSSGGSHVFSTGGGVVASNLYQHLALTYDQASGLAVLYLNGNLVQSANLGSFTPQTSYDFYLGVRASGFNAGGYFAGMMDEPSLYNRALSPAEIQDIYSIGSGGKCAPAVASCVTPPSGLVGWWKGDGNTLDSFGGNNGVNQFVTYSNGVVGQAFAFDPENYPYANYTGIQIADQPAFVLTNSLTIEGWVRPRGNGYNIFWRGDNRPGMDPYVLGMSGSNIGFWITDQNANTVGVQTPISFYNWTHVAATLDGSSGNMSIYINGVLASQTNTAIRPFGALIPGDSPGVGIGNLNDGQNSFPFIGDIDEISLYRRALAVGEIQAIYNAGSAGKCLPFPPAIISQPTNKTVLMGGIATFSVTAISPLPMSYQWTFNTTNLVSATNATLTLNGVTANQAGSYFVIITNQVGSATSSNAVLSIYPSAASFLNGVLFTAGNRLQFTVSGVPGYSYAVQTSTNLINWTWLVTNTAPFNFSDTNNPGLQQQFYRTVYLP